MNTSAHKFDALDTLRGAAAFSVFAYHFYSLSQGKAEFPNVLQLLGEAGHVGLDVFFVLSGFLIFRSLYLQGVNKKYFVRRFLRIAPLYYFALVVVLALTFPSYFSSLAGLWNIVSHLFFFQSFSSETYYGINPVLWSLSVEWIFYLFLPLFFLVTKHKDARILASIFLMIILCAVYRFEIVNYYDQWDSTQRIIYTENFFGRLDQFALGMLASWATLKVSMAKTLSQRSSNFIKMAALLLIVLGTGGLIFGMSLFAKHESGFREIMLLQVFLHSFVGFFAACLIFGLSNSYAFIAKILGNKVFAFLGWISYSFYIWHYIAIQFVLKVGEKMDLFGLEFLLSFLITLFVSAGTYWVIEKRFLAKKTQFKTEQLTPP